MKTALFDYARRRGICDPLTGCFPSSERDLSALLCLHAQRQAIAWDKVPLYDCTTIERVAYARDFITYPGSFVSEYVLPTRDEAEGEIWGGMPVDILYMSADFDSVVLFENKIGHAIGYEKTPASNQLARQLEFLVGLRRRGVPRATLVLISSQSMFERHAYRQEFAGALAFNNRCAYASGYLMHWEDVLDAMESQRVV